MESTARDASDDRCILHHQLTEFTLLKEPRQRFTHRGAIVNCQGAIINCRGTIINHWGTEFNCWGAIFNCQGTDVILNTYKLEHSGIPGSEQELHQPWTGWHHGAP